MLPFFCNKLLINLVVINKCVYLYQITNNMKPYFLYSKQELLKELYTNINHKDKEVILEELQKRPKNKNIAYI